MGSLPDHHTRDHRVVQTPTLSLHSAPLTVVAIGLSCGIAADHTYRASQQLYVSCLLSSALLLPFVLKSIRIRTVLLLLSAASSGALLYGAHCRLPANHIARYVSATPEQTTLEGIVVRRPKVSLTSPTSRPGFKSRFQLRVHRVVHRDIPVTGYVDVTINDYLQDINAGDRIVVSGAVRQWNQPDNPGQPNWALIKRYQDIHAKMICEHAECVRRINVAGGLSRLLNSVRRWTARALLEDNTQTTADHSVLLQAMILGQRSQLSESTRDAFRTTGTAHYLALSGMHVGLLGGFVWLTARLCFVAKRQATVITLLLLSAYMVVIEPQPSAIRACLIAITFCIGYLLWRQSMSLNNLAIAAIFLLVANPAQLFTPGFQLSFAISTGLVLAMPILQRAVRDHWPRRLVIRQQGQTPAPTASRAVSHVAKIVLSSMCVSVVAWLIATPISAYHFGQWPTLGWLASLVMLPFVVLTMLCGFTKLLLGLSLPHSANWVSPLLFGPADLLMDVALVLESHCTLTLPIQQPSMLWMLSYYAFLAGAALAVHRMSGIQRLAVVLITLIAVVAQTLWVASFSVRDATVPEITVLSVGAGTATIIRLPDDVVWLYDAGALGRDQVGEQVIVPALHSMGIKQVSLAIISHADKDHYNGLLAVCDAVPIKGIVLSPHFESAGEPSDLNLLHGIQQRGIPIYRLHTENAAQVLYPERARCQVLWPPPTLPPETSPNNSSIVIRFTLADCNVLFTGDIDEWAQRQLLKKPSELKSDVLMLPHHGSVNPATRQFITTCSPQVVVRSSSRRTVRLPSKLDDIVANYVYFNTADHGAIVLTLESPVAIRYYRQPPDFSVSNADSASRSLESATVVP